MARRVSPAGSAGTAEAQRQDFIGGGILRHRASGDRFYENDLISIKHANAPSVSAFSGTFHLNFPNHPPSREPI